MHESMRECEVDVVKELSAGQQPAALHLHLILIFIQENRKRGPKTTTPFRSPVFLDEDEEKEEEEEEGGALMGS